MAKTEVLKAQIRERVGKGAARESRRVGLVPCVIYGGNKQAESISIEKLVIDKILSSGRMFTSTFNIEIAGNKSLVIPRDVQLDPVRDFPMHVDFLRLSKGATVAVEVPVNFINSEICAGIKLGGILNIVRHTVELNCPVDSIPEEIIADLTELVIGDSLHISAIELPEEVELTITDRDFTIATIASPGGELDDEDAEESDEEEDSDAEDSEDEE